MARVEDDHIAATMGCTACKKRMGRLWWGRNRSRSKGGEIVREGVSGRISLVLNAASTLVAGTKIASRIVFWKRWRLGRFNLAQPWSSGTVRRDKNVLLGQRIDCRSSIKIKLKFVTANRA